MNGNENFWMGWAIIGATVVIAVLTVSSCVQKVNDSDNNAIASAIAHGADPIAARCAVKGGTSTDTGCIMAAARVKAASAP